MKLTASIRREGEWYVAQCLEIDIASQGATEDEAAANLREALELFFEATPAASVELSPAIIRTSDIPVAS